MADHHYPSLPQTQMKKRSTNITTTATSASLIRKLEEHISKSTQLFGLFTLLITGTILLLLTGLTIVATILGLILFVPLIIVSSPIWVPVCTVLFVVTAGFLSTCGFGLVVVAVFLYFRGLQPPGSDRVLDSTGSVLWTVY